MLAVRNLSKSFGSLKAVDNISFQVHAGEIYGLLGPNGAGKTTTISCVCGLLKPDAGGSELEGIDLAEDPLAFKRRIGVVPQEIAIYGDLSAQENVSFWGQLAGLHGRDLRRRVEDVLEIVGLQDRMKDRSSKLSGGMKRRLNLAIGMVHNPRLLLLDEPTVGIDVEARINILKVIRDVVKSGTAVLYTTHYLEEAQDLCDRIGIMDKSCILAEGSLDELRRMVGEGQILTLRGAFSADEFRGVIVEDGGVRIVTLEDGYAMLDVRVERGEVSAVLGRILGQGISVDDISIQEPSLQGVFLKLTGRELSE
ncbi:MAG: ABC transporter ATP-binding protein [Candidatus Eisenbacteria sp.]|nr:ABC transporter ATP-binding protein [Candidatus Eisenbacteria bacterium]